MRTYQTGSNVNQQSPTMFDDKSESSVPEERADVAKAQVV